MPTLFKKADIKLIECPRDAMQGIDHFIPTELKIEYLRMLLKVGFHTLDCGSFVSPAAIPQMRDTTEVLRAIGEEKGHTLYSVIVANRRGAEEAAKHANVDFLGYPFSVSNTFQKRNTNRTIFDSVDLVKEIIEISARASKGLVIYISMGFGNPYGEEWSSSLVVDWVGKLYDLGITDFSLSDTVGVSTPESISDVFRRLQAALPDAEYGAHFHTRPDNWREKVESAYKHGCKRFDGAIAGYGGCPMAADSLVGNMPTENLVDFFGPGPLKINLEAFREASRFAKKVFE